jgi:hypothetical protein
MDNEERETRPREIVHQSLPAAGRDLPVFGRNGIRPFILKVG